MNRLGHVGYVLLAGGTLALALGHEFGWPVRMAGSCLWAWIGYRMNMSSIWFWSSLFAVIDLAGWLQ